MRSSKTTVVDFTDLIIDRGIRHVIICPGSRNAPFIIEMGARKELKCHSVVDERSAAFIALGMARTSRKPVVVVSTSGTAPLNFGPALAEAYYQKVPLIAVTADRPEEWIDQGEGQCIRQQDVFRNYVKAGLHVPEDMGDLAVRTANLSRMAEIVDVSMNHPYGPVHLNFPLAESLYIQEPAEAFAIPATIHATLSDDLQMLNECRAGIGSALKVVVLIGQSHLDDELEEVLHQFAQLPQVAVFTETHSGLWSDSFVPCIDRWIMGAGDRSNMLSEAEIVITAGTNIISRKIKELFRKGRSTHWHLDQGGDFPDTYRKLSGKLSIRPSVAFKYWMDAANPASTFRSDVLNIHQDVRMRARTVLDQCSFSDLRAFDVLMDQVPSGYHVEMGNSSVVRYIQLFDQRKDLSYSGNRGVSGIDGCTSTAIGASYMSGKPSVLISGDIAFLYDSNAFWNELVPSNLKVVVINNGGGGIFRIIDGPKSTDGLEKFFETTHQRSAQAMAAMYGLSYRKVSGADELKEGAAWLFHQEQCAVLEVFTPRTDNDVILRNYFDSIRLY